MRKDITPLTRDKLVVVLMLEDVVNQLNLALKARKASLTLDYTGPQPRTVITMPGSKPHVWFVADRRTKKSMGFRPADPDLRALTDDITHRLSKHDAQLGMGITRLRDQRYMCKLMVFFKDSERIVISLMHAIKNQSSTQNHFLVPKVLQ